MLPFAGIIQIRFKGFSHPVAKSATRTPSVAGRIRRGANYTPISGKVIP
jgi:hypothetical protein